MDMSGIARTAPARAIEPSASAAAIPVDHDRWQRLVSEMGVEIAAPLTAALERINALTSTGKIDKKGLRALREEVEAARQIGMVGQQLARFASGRVRQSHERLPLADVLHSTLAHRGREAQARGISVRPVLKPADVIVDASLLFSLINATIDWALANAHSQIDFGIDLKTWPAHALLSCRFAHRPADTLAEAAPTAAKLDSLGWRLLEQTAWTMGLIVERKDESHVTTLTLEFPRTAAGAAEKLAAVDADESGPSAPHSQLLVGAHVLVISARREVRSQIRQSLRNMSLIIDYVNSVDEASAFCSEGLPHAIVVEGIQTGARFDALRAEIQAEVSGFVFLEIVEDAAAPELSTASAPTMPRIGRESINSALPSALVYELSKSI